MAEGSPEPESIREEGRGQKGLSSAKPNASKQPIRLAHFLSLPRH